MGNKILLKGDYVLEEAIASGTIYPGYLLEVTSATADTVKAHATEGGYAERAVADIDILQGKTASDSYATTTRVTYMVAVPGTQVQMMLKVGENVAKGDQLISAGDGMLIAESSASSGTTVKQIIAIAMEALDLSGSGDESTLLAVRIV